MDGGSGKMADGVTEEEKRSFLWEVAWSGENEGWKWSEVEWGDEV